MLASKILAPWKKPSNSNLYICVRNSIGEGQFFGIIQSLHGKYVPSSSWRRIMKIELITRHNSYIDIATCKIVMDAALIELGYKLYDDQEKFERVMLLV